MAFPFVSKRASRRGQLTAEFLLIALLVVAFAVIVISVANNVVVGPAKNQTFFSVNTSLCMTKDVTCNRTCVDTCSGITRQFNNSCQCGVCVHQQSIVCPSACSYGVCS